MGQIEKIALALACAFFLASGRSASAANATVNISDFAFTDTTSGNSTSTINVGESVTWNWPADNHSTTSGICSGGGGYNGEGTCTADGTWDSAVNSAPHTFTRAFPAAGTFHYYCQIHLGGMTGIVIVKTVVPPPPAGSASGLGVNLAAIGRLIGSGNTLFKTAVDVTNYSSSATQIDFYFNGTSAGQPVSARGSISSAGALVAQGAGGTARGHFNAHFDDFVDALVQAALLPASVETNGVLGSTLFVFNGFNKSGQGAATARFYNDGCGGTVGQAINGREITASEPTKLLAVVRNSIGQDDPQLYPNLFVNNTGLTPSGSSGATAVDVRISAFSNATGSPIGVPATLSGINPGATAVFGNILAALGVPASEDTVVLAINVVSGTAAIDAVVVEIDNQTHDGTTTKAADGSFQGAADVIVNGSEEPVLASADPVIRLPGPATLAHVTGR